jgi:cyclohexyl-isocyanide hydratase
MTEVALAIFPGFELLDVAGPLDVLVRAGDVRATIVARSRDPVTPDLAPAVIPDATFDEIASADVLLVPGGHGIGSALRDDVTLDFLARIGARAAHVSSVCTGALLLGAAGLLDGYRATTHWRYLDLLRIFGAEPVSARVVEDRNRITGGGVTAGIDFAFTLVARLRGEDEAKRIQLGLEYDPAPPFASGHPNVAAKPMVDAYVSATQERYAERERLAREAAARRLRSSHAP